MKARYLWGLGGFALLAGSLALQSDAQAQVRLPDSKTRLTQVIKAAGGTATTPPAELFLLKPGNPVPHNGAFISRMGPGKLLRVAATAEGGYVTPGPSILEFTFPAVVNTLYAFDCAFAFPSAALTSIEFSKKGGTAQSTPVDVGKVVFAIRADSTSQVVTLKIPAAANPTSCKILKAN